MLFAPLEGCRHVEVTDRRTGIDYAHIFKYLSDEVIPHAEKIVPVQDKLNTDFSASLYEAFPPEEARHLVERFEWRYTPKHGSCLSLAESELSVFPKQCINHRIPDKVWLIREVDSWLSHRNENPCKAD